MASPPLRFLSFMYTLYGKVSGNNSAVDKAVDKIAQKLFCFMNDLNRNEKSKTILVQRYFEVWTAP